MSTPEYSLAGKRVLTISPHFFDYENAIADVTRALEAYIAVMLDRPLDAIWTKTATRVFPSAVASRMMEYVRSMQDRYGYQDFDEITVIKGGALTADAVRLLYESFPNA